MKAGEARILILTNNLKNAERQSHKALREIPRSMERR